MKKLAIGCGILVVALVLAATAASYVLYYKVGSTVSSFAELGTIPALNQSVRNQDPYLPPASLELALGQLERFLRVHDAVMGRLGHRMEELVRKYEDDLKDKQEATVADVPMLLSAYRDLATVFVDAKRAQVDALNDAGLSVAEYRWIRTQVYTAIGMSLMDFEGIVGDVQAGRTPVVPMAAIAPEPAGSPATRKLVEPHQKRLEKYAVLASFGL